MELDERDCRRPDWIGGKPIRLSDGQDWLMPPVDFTWVKPGMNPDGRWYGMEPHPNPGDDVMRLLCEIAHISPGPDAEPLMRAKFFALASALLLKNYSLSADDLRELLPFHPDRFAAAMENPLEASDSMMEGVPVLLAYIAHIEKALYQFNAEGIACGHLVNRIDSSQVSYVVPGD